MQQSSQVIYIYFTKELVSKKQVFCVYAAVNIFPSVKFYSSFVFLSMVLYNNEFKTKEGWQLTEEKLTATYTTSKKERILLDQLN